MLRHHEQSEKTLEDPAAWREWKAQHQYPRSPLEHRNGRPHNVAFKVLAVVSSLVLLGVIIREAVPFEGDDAGHEVTAAAPERPRVEQEAAKGRRSPVKDTADADTHTNEAVAVEAVVSERRPTGARPGEAALDLDSTGSASIGAVRTNLDDGATPAPVDTYSEKVPRNVGGVRLVGGAPSFDVAAANMATPPTQASREAVKGGSDIFAGAEEIAAMAPSKASTGQPTAEAASNQVSEQAPGVTAAASAAAQGRVGAVRLEGGASGVPSSIANSAGNGGEVSVIDVAPLTEAAPTSPPLSSGVVHIQARAALPKTSLEDVERQAPSNVSVHMDMKKVLIPAEVGVSGSGNSALGDFGAVHVEGGAVSAVSARESAPSSLGGGLGRGLGAVYVEGKEASSEVIATGAGDKSLGGFGAFRTEGGVVPREDAAAVAGEPLPMHTAQPQGSDAGRIAGSAAGAGAVQAKGSPPTRTVGAKAPSWPLVFATHGDLFAGAEEIPSKVAAPMAGASKVVSGASRATTDAREAGSVKVESSISTAVTARMDAAPSAVMSAQAEAAPSAVMSAQAEAVPSTAGTAHAEVVSNMALRVERADGSATHAHEMGSVHMESSISAAVTAQAEAIPAMAPRVAPADGSPLHAQEAGTVHVESSVLAAVATTTDAASGPVVATLAGSPPSLGVVHAEARLQEASPNSGAVGPPGGEDIHRVGEALTFTFDVHPEGKGLHGLASRFVVITGFDMTTDIGRSSLTGCRHSSRPFVTVISELVHAVVACSPPTISGVAGARRDIAGQAAVGGGPHAIPRRARACRQIQRGGQHVCEANVIFTVEGPRNVPVAPAQQHMRGKE